MQKYLSFVSIISYIVFSMSGGTSFSINVMKRNNSSRYRLASLLRNFYIKKYFLYVLQRNSSKTSFKKSSISLSSICYTGMNTCVIFSLKLCTQAKNSTKTIDVSRDDANLKHFGNIQIDIVKMEQNNNKQQR